MPDLVRAGHHSPTAPSRGDSASDGSSYLECRERRMRSVPGASRSLTASSCVATAATTGHGSARTPPCDGNDRRPVDRTTSTVRARVSRPGNDTRPWMNIIPAGRRAGRRTGGCESHVGAAGPLPQGGAVGAQLDVLPRRGVVAPLGRGADTAAVATSRRCRGGRGGAEGRRLTAGVLDGLPDGAGVEVHPAARHRGPSRERRPSTRGAGRPSHRGTGSRSLG